MIGILLLLNLVAFGAFVLGQPGFISINCGISNNFSYNDSNTGIYYDSDMQYVQSGVNQNISDTFRTPSLPVLYSQLRSFPDGARNCYTLKPLFSGNKYLIRAFFMYGNYDGLSRLPTFDLYLGVNFWKTITTPNASAVFWIEIISLALASSISLCLLNTGYGTPFISAIELRPISSSMYPDVSKTVALTYHDRLNIGGSGLVRYPDDPHDRIWRSYNQPSWTVVSTSHTFTNESDFQTPQAVLRTAVYPTNGSSLDFNWVIGDEGPIQDITVMFVSLYAELVAVAGNDSRGINFFLNGDYLDGPTYPDYLEESSTYWEASWSMDHYVFSMQQDNGSTLPPIVSALEMHVVREFTALATDGNDVDAINNIKAAYHIRSNWMGDPCLPTNYSWEGLNCSTDTSSPPRIIFLNLSSSGLTGEISPYIAVLTSLQRLDLSDNNLTGQIPSFLAELPSLKSLHLAGNQLTGPIPTVLLDKAKNGSLDLSVGVNLLICGRQTSCESHKKNYVLIVAIPAIAGIAILSVILLAATCKLKSVKKEAIQSQWADEGMGSSEQLVLIGSGWKFSYRQILRMTNNLSNLIGQGGFGRVYEGFLVDGTRVAVKMLKETSEENMQQFENEVKVLMSVLHENLVPFYGYCDYGANKALICEYMAGGDLEDYISTKSNRTFLRWEQRLQIALGIARGLEYLHNELHIVHRDLKPANILLNEMLEPKIADFGFGRILKEENVTRVVTKVIGTRGYLDPEYVKSDMASYKSDVYSFGVILLRLITGHPAIIINSTNDVVLLADWAHERSELTDMVDPTLGSEYHIISVTKAIYTAKQCTLRDYEKRPVISNVVPELKACLDMERAQGAKARPNSGYEGEALEVSSE